MIRSQLTYDFAHDHRIKLLVCGDSSVEKTSLLTRFVSDKFNVRQNRTVGKIESPAPDYVVYSYVIEVVIS